MPCLRVNNNSFKVGQTLILMGKPEPNVEYFQIDIGPNEHDIALHINPRFKEKDGKGVVVCNTRTADKWGEHHLVDGPFPFQPDKNFSINVEFKADGFLVNFDNGAKIMYPNILKVTECNRFTFSGQVCFSHVETE